MSDAVGTGTATAPTGPRPPRHQVDPRARLYWLAVELAGLGAVLVLTLVLVVLAVERTALLVGAGVLVVVSLVRVVVVPWLRFRTHRWEATPTAVYARSGWLGREWRVAPLSRVQTVEMTRNPLQRLLGLASVLVTTASSAGPITVEGLDARVADELVAELTHATEQTRGDAT